MQCMVDKTNKILQHFFITKREKIENDKKTIQ